MRILIATHNQAKLKRYQQILADIDGLQLVSLADLGIDDKVDEDCDTNIGNATKKAVFYGDLSGMLTIGIDEAVMTNFLPDNEQPGVYARRFTKDRSEVQDSEYNNIWIEIFKKYPQPGKKFFWSFAIVYYNPVTKMQGSSIVETTSHEAGYYAPNYPAGYPMSAIMSPYENGKPFSDMTDDEIKKVDENSFKPFLNNFKEWIKNQYDN